MGGSSKTLQVLTICGMGMGSSLILKMNAEKALEELGIKAKVEHTDLTSAKSANADVIIAQGMHTKGVQEAAPIVIGISNFLDVDDLKKKLDRELSAAGFKQ